MKALVAATAALALALGVALVPVAPAHAASSPPVDDWAIDHLDFPTPSDPKSLRISVPGSVIDGASKNAGTGGGAAATRMRKQKAAALLAKSRATVGASHLNDVNGPSVRNWLPAAVGSKAATVRASIASKFAVPATASRVISKGLAGAGVASAVLVGGDTGFSVGKEVSYFLGFDVIGGLCFPDFEDLGVIGAVTGTDCEIFGLDPDYIPNTDAGFWTGTACNASTCVTLADVRQPFTPGSTWAGQFQVVVTKTGASVSTLAVTVNVVKESGFTQAMTGIFRNNGTQATGLAGHPYYGWPTPDVANIIGICIATSCPGTGTGGGWSPVELEQGDPVRTVTCEIEGTDGHTYSAISEGYTESSGSLATPECPALPEGVSPIGVTLTENGPNGTKTPIWDEKTTPEYDAWRDRFPECNTGMCILDLKRKVTTAEQWVTCFTSPLDACAEWFKDPNRDTNYQCEYAGEIVELHECFVYATTFRPESVLIGNPWGDPGDGTDLPPAGVRGQLFAKPKVGLPPQDFENCWPSGWSAFNPVQWIAQPIQCVVVWAFVPRPEALEIEVARAGDSWSGTPPGVLAEFLEETADELPDLDGCAGPHIVFAIDFRPVLGSWAHFAVDAHPMAACAGDPLEWVANTLNMLTGLLIYGAATVGISRYIASIVGAPQLGKS